MKTSAERGTLGAWAYEARAEAALSVPEVVRALGERGYQVTEPTIRGIEGGSKKPGRRLVRLLGELYDRPAPGETADVPPDQTLIAQISDLVEELRLTRLEQAEWNRGVTEALALLAGRLPAPAPTNGPEREPSEVVRR